MTLSAPSPYLPGKRARTARTAVLCVAGLCAAASHFEIDHRRSCPNLLLDPVSRPVDRLAQHIVHQMRVALRDGYALVTAPCPSGGPQRAPRPPITPSGGPQRAPRPPITRLAVPRGLHDRRSPVWGSPEGSTTADHPSGAPQRAPRPPITRLGLPKRAPRPPITRLSLGSLGGWSSAHPLGRHVPRLVHPIDPRRSTRDRALR